MTITGKKRGRPSNADREARVRAAYKTNETPNERIARIGERFNVMYKLTGGSIRGTLRSLIVSGAPGTGKSHTILHLLGQAKERGHIQFHKVSGKLTAINLYKLLWRNNTPSNIVVLDDTDSVYEDEDSMNLLKAALDSGDKRILSYMSDAPVLAAEGIEQEFEYTGSMIFITNRHLIMEIELGRSKLIGHYAALIDRSVYLDLKLHEVEDVLAWISYLTIKQHILVQRGTSSNQELMAVRWIQENVDKLSAVSLRTVIKVGDFMLSDPAEWEMLSRVTLFR